MNDNENNWTPGPWEVRHWSGDDWPEKRTSIANKHGQKEALFINARHAKNVEANAHLIAAAPELYEAGKKLRDAQKAYLADRGNDSLGKKVAIAAAELDKALAKARGEE